MIEEMLPHCNNIDEILTRAVMVFSRLSWALVEDIVPIEIFFSRFRPFFAKIFITMIAQVFFFAFV
jgi:hypothetical protein